VAKVARNVALKLAETKRFAVINEQLPLPVNSNANQWFYRNIFSTLANYGYQGVESWKYIGSEIQRPMLKLKFRWDIIWNGFRANTEINYGSVGLTVMIIASNDDSFQAVFGNYPGGTSSGITNWFYNPDGFKPTMNGNNVKVLKVWHRKVTPDQIPTTTGSGYVSGTQVVTGKMSYRWKRKITFEDVSTIPVSGGPTSASITRGWNYYILAGYGLFSTLGSVSALAVPNLNMDSFLYYKDP
jgi:hypothetical protein